MTSVPVQLLELSSFATEGTELLVSCVPPTMAWVVVRVGSTRASCPAHPAVAHIAAPNSRRRRANAVNGRFVGVIVGAPFTRTLYGIGRRAWRQRWRGAYSESIVMADRVVGCMSAETLCAESVGRRGMPRRCRAVARNVRCLRWNRTSHAVVGRRVMKLARGAGKPYSTGVCEWLAIMPPKGRVIAMPVPGRCGVSVFNRPRRARGMRVGPEGSRAGVTSAP